MFISFSLTAQPLLKLKQIWILEELQSVMFLLKLNLLMRIPVLLGSVLLKLFVCLFVSNKEFQQN